MGAVGALLGSKVGLWLLGLVGTGGAWALARKFVPSFVGKEVAAEVTKLLNVNDPADRALIVAFMKWAEVKFPQATGSAKMAAVVDRVCGLFHLPDGAKPQVQELLQLVFQATQAEIQKGAGQP